MELTKSPDLGSKTPFLAKGLYVEPGLGAPATHAAIIAEGRRHFAKASLIEFIKALQNK